MQPRGPSPPVDPNRLHVALVKAVFSLCCRGVDRRFSDWGTESVIVVECDSRVRRVAEAASEAGISECKFVTPFRRVLWFTYREVLRIL